MYITKLAKCYYPKRQKNYCVINCGDDCPKLAISIYGFCGAECLECGGEIIYKRKGIYHCIKCGLKIREI